MAETGSDYAYQLDENVSVEDQLDRVVGQFKAEFGRAPSHASAAPGRVNLIGEHTDYNGGYVLPMAIEKQTVMAASERDDRMVRVKSTAFEEVAEFELSPDLSPGGATWANYLRGVAAGYMARGMTPCGFDCLIDSTVPSGGGLSSSASVEVAMATLIESLTGKHVDPVDKALICQKAEHDFANVPCGLMDQFIVTFAERDAALLIDCELRRVKPVPMKDPDVVILIINTNVPHALVSGEYARRRIQCETAARMLKVQSLRHATMEQLIEMKDRFDQELYRRARHVISENQRTLNFAEAAMAGNWELAGRLMIESHYSLRFDYEVSCRELDILVEMAAFQIECGNMIGSRMTGGGFGGCTVSLVRADKVNDVARELAEGYHQETWLEPSIYISRPAGSVRVLRV